jgi:hypothetical protein
MSHTRRLKLILHRQNVGRGTVARGPLAIALSTLLASSSVAGAQRASAGDPHRWAGAITLDLGALPDDFASQCGTSSAPSYGGGLTAIFRPRRWFITSVDARVSDVMAGGLGCKLTIPAPVQIGPNEWENWAGKAYPSGVAAKPLVRNALHIGVETPPGAPLLRVTVGGGMIWTGSTTPFASIAIGGGSSGRGARFYWEVETNVCAIRVRETHTRFRIDSTVSTPLPSRVVSYVEHPRWTALHVGLEMPLALMP